MTDFAYTLQDMTFANLQIKTPGSVLKGDLKFSYNREDLQYFVDKVQVAASFKDSNVLLDELNTFYNEFGVNQYAKFSADLSGTLNDLQANNLRLNTNYNTRVYGNINFKNLFNFNCLGIGPVNLLAKGLFCLLNKLTAFLEKK